MEFVDSQTYKNLLASYDFDLQSSSKNAIYGKQARSDGYQQIGDIFDETSYQEREHAVVWLKLLNNGVMTSTLDNLEDSYSGPDSQRAATYLDYAYTAEKEGFADIAELFLRATEIQRHFNLRFEQLATNVRDSAVFCKETAMVWICLNCGNLFWGPCAPEVCSFCRYPQSYYQLMCENY